MDWVRTFYRKQHEWSGVCAAAVESWHREKAAALRLPTRPGPYQILELGCGGGQIAVALTELGHQVVAIDLLPEALACAQELATTHRISTIDWVEEDFYAYSIDQRFDMVCYLDGFGIGTDEDQQRLLRRISQWLLPDGRAIIEVYAPAYWRRAAGRSMVWPDVSRQYDYDEEASRLLDTWWATDNPKDTVTQSLRCYAPEELGALVSGTRLHIEKLQPGGAYDHEARTYRDRVSLEACMTYMSILAPDPPLGG